MPTTVTTPDFLEEIHALICERFSSSRFFCYANNGKHIGILLEGDTSHLLTATKMGAVVSTALEVYGFKPLEISVTVTLVRRVCL